MYKVSLINMPYADLMLPSIALTQLRSVLQRRFGDQLRVRLCYLNFDFARYLGHGLYSDLAADITTGLGEWLFRPLAFPEEPDNGNEFLQRYLYQGEKSPLKGKLLAKRTGLERFIGQLAARYRLGEENLVGFTSMFTQNLPSLAMAQLVKQINPRVVTVIGGANCEAPMGLELARHMDQIDFVFSGPSLVNFPRFVQAQIDGQADQCKQLAGVLCRDNLDSEHLNGRGAVGEELPIDVPVPLDYDSFLDKFNQSFAGRLKPSLLLETSRGCWWGERAHCTFCGLNGASMGYRAMPSKMALQLFNDMLNRYAERCSHYELVDNILPKEYLKEVFPHLKTPSGVTFFYEVKADLKASEMRVLGKAGVTQIQPGIEALSTSTLKLMKKGTTAIRNIIFLKNALRFGIRPCWNLLVGFPGETQKTFRKYCRDLPLLGHLPPPTGAFSVRFDRFSPYHVQAKQFGLDLAPYDFYRFLYPIDEESINNLAYYFEDRNYDSQYLVEMVAWKDKIAAKIKDWKNHWCGEDGNLKAQLYLEKPHGPESVRVCDSRSGSWAEHRLNGWQAKILQFLDDRGYRLPAIARHLGIGASQLADEVAQLQGLGLLFEEDGRFVSLALGDAQGEEVLAKRPPSGLIGTHRAEP